jgi:hypothetical protein
MTLGKGRPTPKRSEAERRRRQPYTAPADRKAATKQSRDQDRSERVRRSEALKRGEEWALPPKDKGPVRKLARDYVDSRYGISEYLMFIVLAFFVLSLIPSLKSTSAIEVVTYGILALVLVGVAESMFVGNRVASLARQRFPGESSRGVKLYAAIRGAQIRRLRLPPPNVSRGDKV